MQAPSATDRYTLYRQVAAGGMASVHLGRQRGAGGLGRPVAIKRLHPHLAAEPRFVQMFLDEARLAMRVRHPNVVSTLDVVAHDGELLLVMDYVLGESLSGLMRALGTAGVPARIASGVMAGALHGLHAAHEARAERGEVLGLVHRDVSPQNILVGVDGVARVVDFGVAKAAGRLHSTRGGEVKGKMAYMAPEQLLGAAVDRRTDVFAAAVVLWELLTGRPLFDADSPGAVVNEVLTRTVPPPGAVRPGVSAALDAVVLQGLARHAGERHLSARAMAEALERAVAPATAREIGEWVEAVAGEVVRERAAWLAEVEQALEPPRVSAPVSELPSEISTPPRKRRWLLPAAAALTGAVALGALLLQSRTRAPVTHSAQAVPVPIAGRTPPVVSPQSAVSPPPVAIPTPRRPPPAAMRTRVAQRKPRVSAHPAPPPGPNATAKCANAFRVGEGGVLIPRPECF